MPTTAELTELRDVLLEHALEPHADYQRRGLEYLFGRIIDEGENCATISPEDFRKAVYTDGEAHDPKSPKDAAHNLKREISVKLDEFYEGASGKPPEALKLGQKVKYRARFIEAKGNYKLIFPPYLPKQPETENLVPVFWSPHLRGLATILYPEPFFLIDDRQTYFRNIEMGTGDASVLDYLHIPGTLRTGYTYVPSGVVHAMLMLTKTLRQNDRERRPDFPAHEAVKPGVSIPPGDSDLILLSPPSSTHLVGTIQDGQKMVVDAKGVVHIDGQIHEDSEHTKWGTVTRTWQSHRIVTMLTAKHGRGVEAMTKFLTRHSQLAMLAQRMRCTNAFPETFQVLFRMEVAETHEGPFVKDATVESVYVPEAAPGQPKLSKGEAAG